MTVPIIGVQKYFNFLILIIIFGRMKRIGLFILALAATLAAGAQTLDQGKKYFTQGNYSKAKPIMLKYLKQKPDDASRNYWYGVCCYETGEQDKAVPYLKKAAEKKIFKANRVLGEYYLAKEDYQPAISYFEAFVKGISSDKALHDAQLEARYTTMADSLKILSRMLRNASRVTFIDSMVISRDELFRSYVLGPSTGTFSTRRDFFDDGTEGEVFIPEMEQNIVYSRKSDDGQFRLYTQFKSFDRWEDETVMKGLDTDGDLRYPFLLNDGITIYYAATGSESLGGLDIFVSRYNSTTGRYLKPDNIGMPFNSPANDYFYVVDEANELGWFATDRGQNADSVCIYVFIPTDGNRKYNYENGDTAAIHRAARLTSIAETQTDQREVRAARQRLTLLRYELSEQAGKGSFTYIIDDVTTYHETSDFRNPEAAAMFEQWQELEKQFKSDAAGLDKMRGRYSNASRQEKEQMKDGLLELEDRVLEAERQVTRMENDIRTTEINFLNR